MSNPKFRRNIIPYNPRLKQLARNLRNNSTKLEIFLWLHLKGKKMRGYDFHRQKPINNYILDFFCNELMLGIELDGFSHQTEIVHEKDLAKEEKMRELGITILRFNDEDVYHRLGFILHEIEAFIDEFELKNPN